MIRERSTRLRSNAAIGAVVLLAVAVTLWSARQAADASFRSLRFVDYAVLAVLFAGIVTLDRLQVTLAQGKFSAAFTVSGTAFIAAGIGYGPIVGVVFAAFATLIGEIAARREPRKLLFNTAQFVCGAGVAGLLYHGLAGDGAGVPLASLRTTVVALIAAAAYLVTNAVLVAMVVGVSIGKSPLTIFLANVPGFFVQNISLFSIGLILTTVRALNPFAVVIVLLSLLGPLVAMRGHRDSVLQIRQTIEALADTVDRRDTSTAQHSERVAQYARLIVEALGTIRVAESEAIGLAARVHDLGKIAIPDAILLKPGRLDDGEFRLMRWHPVAGDEILRRLSIYKDSLGVARHHHERYDGTGYPDGLKGEEIPLGARIVAVADAYDVMTSDRLYARARTMREARAELIACKGTHFDPRVVDAFVAVLDRQHRLAANDIAMPSTASVSSAAG